MTREGLPPPDPEASEPLEETTELTLSPVVLAWIGIGLVALLVRALLLDRAALAPAEARYAFGAWQASQGQLDSSLVELGAPLLSYLMTGLFFLLGSSDAGARVVPVFAGVGLALTPILLMPTIGWRASLAAGALIALCPAAVELARVSDPASISALVTMVVIASAIRLFVDRPGWSPWLLAVSGGLALVSSSGTVIALGTAVFAAFATWSLSRAQVMTLVRGAVVPATRGVWATAGLVIVVAGTAFFTDLRGIGFALGDIWGGAAAILTPAPFPSRNLGAMLAYAGPILVLAVVGFVRGARRGDRTALFLGEWTLLLVAVGAVFGQSTLTLALLPVAPAALLAGLALEGLPSSVAAYRLSSSSSGVIALATVLGGVVVLTIARSTGDSRGLPWVALAIALVAAALVAYLWLLEVPRSERLPALVVLGAGLLLAFSIGSIGRLSFGGSAVGTEILVREETASDLRPVFDDLTVMTMGDSSRVLLYSATTPLELRWYGRFIAQTPAERAPERGGISFREAPPVDSSLASAPGGRTPWKTISTLNRNDLNPLGILRWVVTRKGLVEGHMRDIIVVQ